MVGFLAITAANSSQNLTRHRSSTSMYSLTVCVRLLLNMSEHECKVTPADDDFILPVTTRSMFTRPSLDLTAEGTAPALQPVSAPALTTDAESEIGLLSEPATSEICVDSPTDLCNDTSVTETQIPVISGEDYKTDSEFQAMYIYLRYGDLSGNDKTDKTTLLITDQFILEDDILYRLETRRKKASGAFETINQTSLRAPQI